MKLNEQLKVYDKLGFSYFPLPYKAKKDDTFKWGKYRYNRRTEAEKQRWFGNGKPTNTAIICGKISGQNGSSLVVLDLDDVPSYEALDMLTVSKMGDNLCNLTWVVRTSRGYQVYFYVEEPTISQDLEEPIELEVRAENRYVVAPPSVHPMGATYELINPAIPRPLTIKSLLDIGINVNQPKPQKADGTPNNWIAEALKGVPEGKRNNKCKSLAGYYIGKNIAPDIVKLNLYDFADRCGQPPEAEKPFTHQDVDSIVDNIYFKEISKTPEDTIRDNTPTGVPNTPIYINRENSTGVDDNSSLVTSTLHLQDVYKSSTSQKGYGSISQTFDDYMQNNPEPHKRRDVAEICDVSQADRSFIQHLWRRGHNDDPPKIRHLPNDYIQWINTNWKDFLVDPDAENRPYLDLLLPFGAEKLIRTPEKTQLLVGGDGGGGKTHFGYMIADLNVGKGRPIRHFVVEDGDQRMLTLLNDYPRLKDAYHAHDGSYYLINPSKGEGLDVAENLDPEGINIFDYPRIPNRDNWFLAVQREMVRLSDKISTGAVIVMAQKKRGDPLPFGRDWTKMQCDAAFCLHIDDDVAETATDYGHKACHVTIEKARSYAGKQNPETQACGYRTAPLHGKLVPDTEGWIARENFES